MSRDEAVVAAKLAANVTQTAMDIWEHVGDAKSPAQGRFIARPSTQPKPVNRAWAKVATVEVDGTMRGVNFAIPEMLPGPAVVPKEPSGSAATAHLLAAAQLALEEMRHTVAPRHSFTDAVDALDAAITGVLHG